MVDKAPEGATLMGYRGTTKGIINKMMEAEKANPGSAAALYMDMAETKEAYFGSGVYVTRSLEDAKWYAYMAKVMSKFQGWEDGAPALLEIYRKKIEPSEFVARKVSNTTLAKRLGGTIPHETVDEIQADPHRFPLGNPRDNYTVLITDKAVGSEHVEYYAVPSKIDAEKR